LFLDEIGEMPMALQAKLLRVLQDQVVERLGSMRSTHCDVRIIAATNQDLSQRVKEGQFREDLYFRLAVFPIRIPPLRDRKADIEPLSRYFLSQYSRTMGRSNMVLSPACLDVLQHHAWPGNVRELENAIQRALLLCDGQTIEPADLEIQPMAGLSPHAPAAGTEIASFSGDDPALAAQDIDSIERKHILKILKQVGGNRKEAVEILGLSERALRYKLKAYKEAGFDVD
jgi:two-component system response regulator FlrC